MPNRRHSSGVHRIYASVKSAGHAAGVNLEDIAWPLFSIASDMSDGLQTAPIEVNLLPPVGGDLPGVVAPVTPLTFLDSKVTVIGAKMSVRDLFLEKPGFAHFQIFVSPIFPCAATMSKVAPQQTACI